MLKKTRVFLSSLVFTALTLFFLDFASVLPSWFSELTAIQAVPALLAVNASVLAALVVLTLVFGRVYCSVLCPLGVLQDILGRLSGLFAKKERKFRFAPAKTGLRWSLAAVAVIGPLTGMTVLLSLLEPYSIFGRAITHVFRPVYIAGNNFLEKLLVQFDLYVLYHFNNSPLSLVALITAAIGLLVVGYLACKHGRAYCNTLCPVGTVLGAIGNKPLFGIRIDAEACTRCGRCEARCKSSCIASRSFFVDHSRCVACMNCLGRCENGALGFSFHFPFAGGKKKKPEEGDTRAQSKESPPIYCLGSQTAENGGFERNLPSLAVGSFLAASGGNSRLAATGHDSPVNNSRRGFLLGALAVLPGLLPGVSLASDEKNVLLSRQHPILPPGAGSLADFRARCTACHACVGKCPSRVLKPALLEYGPGGFLQPLMDYSDGFCNYDCTVCTDICPNGALRPLSLKEKHYAQIGRVVFVEELCVVRTNGTHCGACAEHCPTQAVTMVPYANGVTIPAITPNLCVGCGGCEFICPVRPFRAIFVEGLSEQGIRESIQEEKREDIQIDSFGF